MALPNVTINLENGNLGRIAQSDDGVAGLILTGAAVSDKLALNEVYLINSSRDIARLGITAENNPLAHKELTAFYTETGDGAELYLLVVSEATLLSQMCSIEEGSPLKKLITYAKGRIRLVGINRLPPDEYSADTTDTGIDKDAVTAATAAQSVGESFARKVMPFRCLIPAAGWDGKTDKLYKPREGSTNRVGFVMACDDQANKTAAIGQMLGRAARISVNQSLARVKSGAITAEGWLTNGRTPEECDAMLDLLDEAGYIIYRSFSKKNGYYPNDDHMGAPAVGRLQQPELRTCGGQGHDLRLYCLHRGDSGRHRDRRRGQHPAGDVLVLRTPDRQRRRSGDAGRDQRLQIVCRSGAECPLDPAHGGFVQDQTAGHAAVHHRKPRI